MAITKIRAVMYVAVIVHVVVLLLVNLRRFQPTQTVKGMQQNTRVRNESLTEDNDWVSCHDQIKNNIVMYEHLDDEKTKNNKGMLLFEDFVVVERLKKCLTVSNMTSYLSDIGSLERAERNAVDYLRALRRVIPQNFSNQFYSPCWKAEVEVDCNTHKVGDKVFPMQHGPLRKCTMPKFTTHTPCLPKFFLLGFAKCGSTFTYCLMTHGLGIKNFQAVKEPHWWVPGAPWSHPRVTEAGDVFRYLVNFAKASVVLDRKQLLSTESPVTIDSSPNLVHQWIRTRQREPPVNYCLMPALIPLILPDSKYVIVLRNPVTRLYSSFWFSCHSKGKIAKETLLKHAPDLFHERIVLKIDIFQNCTEYYSIEKCAADLDEISLESLPELEQCGRTDLEIVMYALHIQKWLSVVPRSKFFFLKSEELHDRSDAKIISRKLWEFFELPWEYGFDASHVDQCYSGSKRGTVQKYGNDPQLQMREDTRKLLVDFYRPFNQRLA